MTDLPAVEAYRQWRKLHARTLSQSSAIAHADTAIRDLAEALRLAQEERDWLVAAVVEAGAFCWADASQNHPARIQLRSVLRDIYAAAHPVLTPVPTPPQTRRRSEHPH